MTAFTLERHLKGFYWKTMGQRAPAACQDAVCYSRPSSNKGLWRPSQHLLEQKATSLGRACPRCQRSPGHDAELAADGAGLLGRAQQLGAAPRVQAVPGDDVAEANEGPAVGSHLPRAGDELGLALK